MSMLRFIVNDFMRLYSFNLRAKRGFAATTLTHTRESYCEDNE